MRSLYLGLVAIAVIGMAAPAFADVDHSHPHNTVLAAPTEACLVQALTEQDTSRSFAALEACAVYAGADAVTVTLPIVLSYVENRGEMPTVHQLLGEPRRLQRVNYERDESSLWRAAIPLVLIPIAYKMASSIALRVAARSTTVLIC